MVYIKFNWSNNQITFNEWFPRSTTFSWTNSNKGLDQVSLCMRAEDSTPSFQFKYEALGAGILMKLIYNAFILPSYEVETNRIYSMLIYNLLLRIWLWNEDVRCEMKMSATFFNMRVAIWLLKHISVNVIGPIPFSIYHNTRVTIHGYDSVWAHHHPIR